MVHGPFHPVVRRPHETIPKLRAAPGVRKTYTEKRRDATEAAELHEATAQRQFARPAFAWPALRLAATGDNPLEHRRRRAPMVTLPRRDSPTRHHRERNTFRRVGRGRMRLGFSKDAIIGSREGRLTPG